LIVGILNFLKGNRGRHATCRGHHWHMQMSGWRCCGCTDTYPSGDRPEDVGRCRLNDNGGVPDTLAGRQPVPEEDLQWLAELTGPGNNTTVLPGTGKRHLADDARRGVFKGTAKVVVPVNQSGNPAPFRARHRAAGP
jgi:hypothetical protein